MLKFALFLWVQLLVAFGAHTLNDNIDLSGRWQLSIGHDQEQGSEPVVLNFIKTPCLSEQGEVLYSAQGEFGAWHLWGASVERIEGRSYIAWGTLRENKFDDEFSIIIGNFTNELILGGDFGEQEIARLKKIE
jgi:hypothetical protein